MSEQKTHWKKLTNPDYLGAYAFDPGEEKALTIREVKRETVTGADGKKEDCTVCYWAEDAKPLILNTTNQKMISKVVGSPYIEDWAGKRILLGTETVAAFGERVEAVRVRKRQPPALVEAVCADCGQFVKAASKFTAAQVEAATVKAYGAALCWECARTRKEAMVPDKKEGVAE